MADAEAVPNLDFGAIVAPYAQQSPDNAVLVPVPPEGMVQDGEESLRRSINTDTEQAPSIAGDRTWVCIVTLRGAVVACAWGTGTVGRGRAR